MNKKHKKTASLGMRLTQEQKEMIRKRADILDMTITDYLVWIVAKDTSGAGFLPFLKAILKSILKRGEG